MLKRTRDRVTPVDIVSTVMDMAIRIAKAIERTSQDLLEVEQGSLYPTLHRLE
ncbi:MAG TPA: helix-turn-helix transcriptional regulator [Acidobacteriaceae bacterium]|nr:helix-turn-helix transcriptional regulator [Acidobacteriaceae bacterium]